VPSRSLAVWAVLLVTLPALAGCASKDTPASTKSVSGGSVGGAPSTSTGTAAEPPPPPPISGTSSRWHFHDYWKGKPTITLSSVDINLTPGPGGISYLLELPQGVIVPPETGFLTINVSWPQPATGVVNVTYKPADSNDYFTLPHDATSGKPIFINTTESMTDVPHRQQSLWRFNLTAMPGTDTTPPGVPTTQLHVEIKATIGRPLFIDPPHFNWWQDDLVIPLVAPTSGDISEGTTPAGNVSAPDPTGLPVKPGVVPRQDQVFTYAQSANASVRVPVTQGRIVPEGAKTVVVLLNWSSSAPNAPKLKVSYEEGNNPSSGVMPVAVDGASSRVFVLPVQPPQTDTTYSNRTTWQFHVLPEGDAAAFKGSFVMTAWVTRLEGAAAAKVGQTGGAQPR